MSEMPLCITGMHRSGTSMIARILNLCGLYLGAEEEIMPPDKGNPAGYWQNLEMDQISEAILADFSGGWDFLLPIMPAGWEHRDSLNQFRTRAQRRIASLEASKPWGWKDPRASLTLPFWKALLPNLKVIICLRNPIEVADSLHKHTGSTAAFAYNLWIRYNQRILHDIPVDDRIITHYDMYFIDATAEIKRLIDWLEWSVNEEQLDEAIEFVSSKLRQHKLTTADIEQTRAPAEAVELYKSLCFEGGENLQAALSAGTIFKLHPGEVIGVNLPEKGTISSEMQAEADEIFRQANTLISQDNLVAAMEALEKAVSVNPYLAEAQNDLGVLYLAEGDPERAITHLELAARFNPDSTDTIKNLTEALVHAGRIEDAIQIMLDLVQRQSDDVDALYWLATACMSQGQKPEARELFSRILQLNPEHPGAMRGLSESEVNPSPKA